MKVKQRQFYQPFGIVITGNHFGKIRHYGWVSENVNGDGTIDVFDMVTISN